jgi:hypothetical protein
VSKSDLIKLCKEHFFYYDLSFNKQVNYKSVVFNVWGKDTRQVCCLEIPFKNNIEKNEIYFLIESLIKGFAFDFRVCFESKKEVYKFLNINEVV